MFHELKLTAHQIERLKLICALFDERISDKFANENNFLDNYDCVSADYYEKQRERIFNQFQSDLNILDELKNILEI